jgi:hypothetical protein
MPFRGLDTRAKGEKRSDLAESCYTSVPPQDLFNNALQKEIQRGNTRGANEESDRSPALPKTAGREQKGKDKRMQNQIGVQLSPKLLAETLALRTALDSRCEKRVFAASLIRAIIEGVVRSNFKFDEVKSEGELSQLISACISRGQAVKNA